MKGFWRARQKSVGCISPHAWKLPLIMAVCILVYSLPLSLAVSVEPPSEPRKMIIYLQFRFYAAMLESNVFLCSSMLFSTGTPSCSMSKVQPKHLGRHLIGSLIPMPSIQLSSFCRYVHGTILMAHFIPRMAHTEIYH